MTEVVIAFAALIVMRGMGLDLQRRWPFCSRHPVALRYVTGVSIYPFWQCPECQRELMAILDEMPPRSAEDARSGPNGEDAGSNPVGAANAEG
jgi:hypothetical protein